MIAESILSVLLRLNVIAAAAILLVLALRPLLLRRFGAGIAYSLWLAVPVTALAVFMPVREQVVLIQSVAPAIVGAQQVADGDVAATPAAATASAAVAATPSSLPTLAGLLVLAWLLGAAALLSRSILITRRLATDPSLGPALVGVFRPRLVLPGDFQTRFDAGERALILAHEQVHRVSGHVVVNALIEFIRCVNWFNPLVHLAARRIRVDQELACDAAVIAVRPEARRAYAEVLLKTHSAAAFLPLGCAWTSSAGKRLGERVAMLGVSAGSRLNRIAGVAGIALLGAGMAFGAWSQQPARQVTQTVSVPAPVWTPTAQAPKGALSTALEGDRHDRAIKLARQGNIDVVFFGTTNTEMWWWPDRGRPVWDRRFKAIKAANFGSQGTLRDSLVWRMRNGELAGFQAKIVVLQTWLGAGLAVAPAEASATYAPIIAEIRRWQPQAKILLLADFPRGQVDRTAWRQVAKANTAAFASLVDSKTVFYVDMGERFFRADGTHDQDMWQFAPVSGMAKVGMQAAGFEAWADELQPWLERFAR